MCGNEMEKFMKDKKLGIYYKIYVTWGMLKLLIVIQV